MVEFSCTNCGHCCGPVPISINELENIKETIEKMPNKRIKQLRTQKRDSFTCILWDTQEKRCSVYESRPQICRMFGFYQGMECSNNTSHANKSRGAGDKALKEVNNDFAGVLTTQIKWKNLLGS